MKTLVNEIHDLEDLFTTLNDCAVLATGVNEVKKTDELSDWVDPIPIVDF